jgi:hypothetical protein
MKIKTLLSLSVMLCLMASCKKDANPEPEPDPYAFLEGKWAYENGAECVFALETKSAAGTKPPTNNIYGFVIGEPYWKNVVSTGTDEWAYDQIVRSSDGVTVEYRESTMSRKDDNTLNMSTPGLSDSELKRVL